MSWGYQSDNGPATWGIHYEQARGNHQSPININESTTIFDNELLKHPLTFNYSNENFVTLKNTGHSFTVSGSDKAESSVNGGPVHHNHNFLQFHMHWGQNDHVGSEHTLNGESYAAEIHFVNWNSEKFKEPSHAVNANDHTGLIVLGVFVKVGKHNPELEKIVNALSKISLPGESVELGEPLNYLNLFPADRSSYYNYDGSLTTPPCNECVQWVVFKDAIEISSEQLNAFRNLHETADGHQKQEKNFRPVCSLNNRVVRRSFN
jgi:carbonic anhydrase